MVLDLDQLILKYSREQRGNLIPMLQEIQEELGYLPEDVVPKLAKHLGLPEVKIYSVATFYNQFHFEPTGKFHLQVCSGTGCHLDGSSRILREIERILEIGEGEMTKDQMFSLELVPCLGACHLAPVISINGELQGQLSSRKLAELLDNLRNS
ncbi:MAG: NAD(P)H-dependent oxidoreductase subunit E [Bacteroidota bacterium]|nr:NAD(P)H-dependent oxidoreductase subunit E [Bacteroidota bacterium]